VKKPKPKKRTKPKPQKPQKNSEYMGKTDKEEDPDMISKDPAERKKQDEAAVRIQANWKGKQDREKVK
jgi:hypothetical protein